MAEEDAQSGTVPDDPQSQPSETPTNIQAQDSGPKYEDISLPDNSNHKAIIEIHYKRYVMLFGLGVFLLLGFLFGTGLLSVENTEIATIVSSALIVPLFILFWLFEHRANS